MVMSQGALFEVLPVGGARGPRRPAGNTPANIDRGGDGASGREGALVRAAVADGARDESRLTSLVFHARHPERQGRPLARSERALIGEWLAIRDRLVRPVLARPGATSARRGGDSGSAPGTLPQGPFGTLALSGPGGIAWRYAFTPEDVLWTARFLTGEAGGRDNRENLAVLWAMFNRYALFTRRVRRFDRFHRFLRAYSTPLQPVLNSAGAARRHVDSPGFVRTGGHYAPPDQAIPRGQTERHLQLQQMPWHELPPAARALAVRALRGELPNPGIGNASEFANTATYYFHRHNRTRPTPEQWRKFNIAFASSKRKDNHPGWTWIGDVDGLKQLGINTFFIDNRTARLPANTVRVIPPQ